MFTFLRDLPTASMVLERNWKEIAIAFKCGYKDELHLSVSMRSFRAENVSLLVKQMLDLNIE